MEEEQGYLIEITPEAEINYLHLLEHLYKTHTKENAERKADEILEMAMTLDKQVHRGRIEDKLRFLGKTHPVVLSLAKRT